MLKEEIFVAFEKKIKSQKSRAPRGTSEKRYARVAHARDATAHGNGVARAPRGTSATRTAHGNKWRIILCV